MRRFLVFPLVLVVLAAVPALAVPVQVTSCGQHVEGHAVLAGDLDCSNAPQPIEIIGRLDLAGHTITGPATRETIHCLSSCKIIGPGTITGTGTTGVLGRKSLTVRDVTITGTQVAVAAIPTVGKGHALIQGCTFDGNAYGVSTQVPLLLKDSVISNSAHTGLIAGSFVEEDGGFPCEASAHARLLRSTVTGSGGDPACGTSTNCADVFACSAGDVHLVKSSCGTSCLADTGLPCTTLDICSGD